MIALPSPSEELQTVALALGKVIDGGAHGSAVQPDCRSTAVAAGAGLLGGAPLVVRHAAQKQQHLMFVVAGRRLVVLPSFSTRSIVRGRWQGGHVNHCPVGTTAHTCAAEGSTLWRAL